MVEDDSFTTYGLNPRFERAVVWRACSDGKFYLQIGKHIDADLLESDIAKQLITAAHAIFALTSAPPKSTVIVLQRLQDLHENGELDRGSILEGDDYFERAEVDDTPIEQLIAFMKPKIQSALGRQATREAIQVSDPTQLRTIARSFERAASVGEIDDGHGFIFKPEDWSNIDMLSRGDRLGFDLFELEEITNGGLQRGMAGMACAPSGGGKTTFLSHVGCTAWRQGLTVAYATLELAVGQIEEKFRGAISNIELNMLATNKAARARCEQAIREARGLGGLAIKKFPARKSTWPMLVEWFEGLADADALGELPQVFIVDFLGKLGHPDPRKSRYEAHGEIMDSMHDYAEDANIWLWTASQPKRAPDKSKRKVIDNDDLNDSQGKIEGADLFISLNPREDNTQLYYWVGKHRAGPSQLGCGPFPHDFSYGRIVPPGYQSSASMMSPQDRDLFDRLEA